jgi:hypothetical protein
MGQNSKLAITTSWGQMVRLNETDDQWQGATEINGCDFDIFVNNVNGAPNPHFLTLLPAVIQQLPDLEQKARQAVSRISSNHQLGSISDVWPYSHREKMDYALGFDYDDENWGETVFVEFKDQAVVSWSSAD